MSFLKVFIFFKNTGLIIQTGSTQVWFLQWGGGVHHYFLSPDTGTGLAFTYMKSECPGIPRGGGGEGGGGSEALAQLAIGTFFPKMITSFFFMASLSQFVLMGN